MSLFSLKELFELEEKTKLELIFENLDLTSVVNNLRTDSKKGPKGYNIRPIIRAFLAQRLENIPTRAALVRRLNNDPVFSYICGFGFYEKVPSEATLSRYFKKLSESNSLKELYIQLLSEANELDLLDLETIAIDASKLKSYERAKPKSQIDKENLNTPDWGAKFDSFKNKTTWYGWKVHLAVDTESELPIAITVTPANEADSNQALSLVQMVSEVMTGIKCEQTKYWVMDSGYDFTYIYESILFDYNSQAIIPINKRNAKQPPAGYYDFDGTPECSAGHKMAYWGYYKGDNKFRCPDVCGKVDCVHGSAWCSKSNYGHVTKTRPKEDPRYVSTPHRGSKTWQKIYNKRTSVERTFGRLKENLGLKNVRVMGKKKVKTHILLSCIGLIAAKITVEKLKNQEKELAA